mgnify:CR=1 FL=1
MPTIQSIARPLTFAAALIAAATAITACSPDPQEQYEDATTNLEEAREARNEAQEALEAKKEELAELRSNLNEAEAELQAARQKVDEASQKVDKTVTDEVLFRKIQRELLDEDQFEEAAISVGVTDRVVTLGGNVPDEETRKAALESARSQPGVKDVVDSMEVRDSESAPSEKSSEGKADGGDSNGGGSNADGNGGSNGGGSDGGKS